MGLFDNIHQEVAEMFQEMSSASYLGNPLFKGAVHQIVKEIRSGKSCSSSLYGNTGQLLRIVDGSFSISKSRFDVFYKRAGQIVTAIDLLKTGLYSMREVARIVGISKDTCNKLLKRMPELKCVCGTLLISHRGWCGHRFKKSEKRQRFMLHLSKNNLP